MHFTIVSYTFPPSNSIGGRRWAKFSKQLCRTGNEVTVVCANDSVPKEWYEKEYRGIDFRLLPKYYPDWLNGRSKSFFKKILYWIAINAINPFTKQNIFDVGIGWKRPMLKALESIHQQKEIDVLIVTGAPFSLLYFGTEFRRRNKDVFYITDFRDPWTWGKHYGIPTLSNLKKKHQEESENLVMMYSDLVCFPTDHMGDFLKRKYPDCISKLYLLPHAYEPEKFPQLVTDNKKEGFIYGGTLYVGIEEYITKLLNVLKANPTSGFKWDIYTGTNFPILESNVEQVGIRKHYFISEELLFKKIKKSAAYLALYPPADKDLVSTKFFEIIHSKIPILYIGEEGEVGRFIRENRAGVHVLPENIERDLPQYLHGEIPFEEGYFDVGQYTFSSVTAKFISEINRRRINN